MLEENEGRVACVILEAASALAEPAPGLPRGRAGALRPARRRAVFDETITGFRWAAGGAQSVYGVTPDLSTWGKAMGNGFPIAALAGQRELMELGGLRHRPAAGLPAVQHPRRRDGVARRVPRRRQAPTGETDPVAIMERQGRCSPTA